MAASKIFLTLLAMVSLVPTSEAHPEYQARMPNAMDVKGVEAIGHINKGHGARNSFGKDFGLADKTWTVALCEKDSDGDGQTNGQELGDPCCQWVQASNEKVLWVDGVSAPGDAMSKSDPMRWANVTCPPSSRIDAQVIATGAAAGPMAGVSVVAISAVFSVAVLNSISS